MDDFTNGITEEEALYLHKKDWEIHYNIAKTDFEVKTRSKFEICCLIGKLVAGDIAYNIGKLSNFPKFMEALKENNVKEMMKESKTYANINGVMKELTSRNEFRRKWLSFIKK